MGILNGVLPKNLKFLPAVLIFALAPASLPAATIFTALLLGSNEVPPNASPATGQATVTLNGNFLTVMESFSGLTTAASAAHIHCCAPAGAIAIVAIPFAGFPSATSGSYSNTFDLTLLSTYAAGFVTANGGTAATAEAAFIAGLSAFQAYANIHDATYVAGEIRGQLVPEPATVGMLLAGLAFIAMARRGVAKRRTELER